MLKLGLGGSRQDSHWRFLQVVVPVPCRWCFSSVLVAFLISSCLSGEFLVLGLGVWCSWCLVLSHTLYCSAIRGSVGLCAGLFLKVKSIPRSSGLVLVMLLGGGSGSGDDPSLVWFWFLVLVDIFEFLRRQKSWDEL
jgi:hypothetical protein